MADLLRWRTTQVVEAVDISLTDREANELYSDIYRMQRDLPGARENYSMVFAVYDTLNVAGVDGTRCGATPALDDVADPLLDEYRPVADKVLLRLRESLTQALRDEGL